MTKDRAIQAVRRGQDPCTKRGADNLFEGCIRMGTRRGYFPDHPVARRNFENWLALVVATSGALVSAEGRKTDS